MRIIAPILAGVLVLGSAVAASADAGKPRVVRKKVVISSGPRLGVQVTPLTEDLRKFFGAGERAGVLVGGVEPGSPAAQAGVQIGDVLTEVDGQEVAGSMDVLRRLGDKRAGDTVSLSVVRAKKKLSLTAKLDEQWSGERRVESHDGTDGNFDFDFDLPDGRGMGRMFLFNDEERVRDLERKIEKLEQRLQKLEQK